MEISGKNYGTACMFGRSPSSATNFETVNEQLAYIRRLVIRGALGAPTPAFPTLAKDIFVKHLYLAMYYLIIPITKNLRPPLKFTQWRPCCNQLTEVCHRCQLEITRFENMLVMF